jgi:hypothetical protein
MVSSVPRQAMKSLRKWLTENPLGIALACLAVALGNAFEASYLDDPNGLMTVLS